MQKILFRIILCKQGVILLNKLLFIIPLNKVLLIAQIKNIIYIFENGNTSIHIFKEKRISYAFERILSIPFKRV